MKFLSSVKNIEKSYSTGEEPVLVACNDHNSYICKYTRYSGSANKLVCELFGTAFAKMWNLNTPDIALVKVKQEHVPYYMSGAFFSKPIIGSLQQHNVVDITPTTIPLIPCSEKLIKQMLHVALFDMWLSNEDRNANNYNLMYDIINGDIISIDYGCCFNTATFDYTLSLLTESESVLCSDLFLFNSKALGRDRVLQIADVLLSDEFPRYVSICENGTAIVRRDENTCDASDYYIPSAWNIDRDRMERKVKELLENEWIGRVKDGFVETLYTALDYEQ